MSGLPPDEPPVWPSRRAMLEVAADKLLDLRLPPGARVLAVGPKRIPGTFYVQPGGVLEVVIEAPWLAEQPQHPGAERLPVISVEQLDAHANDTWRDAVRPTAIDAVRKLRAATGRWLEQLGADDGR